MNMVDRRQWVPDSGVNCTICPHTQRETREHLFFNYTFAWRCWRELNISWNSDVQMDAMFEEAKRDFQGPNFFEVANCALWGIWKESNAFIFEGKQPSLVAWKVVFKLDYS